MSAPDEWTSIALVAGAYLVGSFSLGLLLAQRAGIDLRKAGSGNIGATNVERTLGRGAGLAVLVADLAKGAAPVGLAWWLGADDALVAATGVAATMGHVWPIYYGFRGGKGAATAGGVLLASVPAAGGVALVTYFVVRGLTKLSSVGSLAAAAAGAGVVAFVESSGWLRGMAAMLVLLVVVRHRDNIVRLARGQERPAGSTDERSVESAPTSPRERTDEGDDTNARERTDEGDDTNARERTDEGDDTSARERTDEGDDTNARERSAEVDDPSSR